MHRCFGAVSQRAAWLGIALVANWKFPKRVTIVKDQGGGCQNGHLASKIKVEAAIASNCRKSRRKLPNGVTVVDIKVEVAQVSNSRRKSKWKLPMCVTVIEYRIRVQLCTTGNCGSGRSELTTLQGKPSVRSSFSSGLRTGNFVDCEKQLLELWATSALRLATSGRAASGSSELWAQNRQCCHKKKQLLGAVGSGLASLSYVASPYARKDIFHQGNFCCVVSHGCS